MKRNVRCKLSGFTQRAPSSPDAKTLRDCWISLGKDKPTNRRTTIPLNIRAQFGPALEKQGEDSCIPIKAIIGNLPLAKEPNQGNIFDYFSNDFHFPALLAE